MVNRSDDWYAILDDGTYGMQGALKPTLKMYDDTEGIGIFLKRGEEDILIIKPYEFSREIRRWPTHETRRWTIDCILIAEKGWDELENFFDEVRRVIDLYNSAPRAENSHTYDEIIFVTMGVTSGYIPSLFNIEFTIQLVQYTATVVIA